MLGHHTCFLADISKDCHILLIDYPKPTIFSAGVTSLTSHQKSDVFQTHLPSHPPTILFYRIRKGMKTRPVLDLRRPDQRNRFS